MALRKIGVIPFVTNVSFKRIFVFTLTEQAQKGCDPLVHLLQGPVPEEKARIFLAGNSQVKLPKPIGEQSVYALKYEVFLLKKKGKRKGP